MIPSHDVRTVDYHTAGEPFRIVLSGVGDIPGATVAARREAARAERVDVVRRLLCHEPRGHADMYGCFLVPPDDDGADLGVLFWHRDGYSTACGHGTIALGTWAVETGRVACAPDGAADVVVDVPSGRVTARVHRRGGVVTGVAFRNVPAYTVARALTVAIARSDVAVDVAYGGALYASLPAAALGLDVTPRHLPNLVAAAAEVKAALVDHDAARHPDPRLSGIYGVSFHDELDGEGPGPAQRTVTVFADGEVDRSPCGSGTSARVALLAADGRVDESRPLTHVSIVGTRFTGRVVERVTVDGRPAVVTEVDGTAHRTGEHRFVLDPRDPLSAGFLLR